MLRKVVASRRVFLSLDFTLIITVTYILNIQQTNIIVNRTTYNSPYAPVL